jgi:phosphate-selective porin
VLALRYSALALDEDLESAALVVPGTYTDRISSLSLGLNWIPNEHAILRTAWVQSLYADEVALDRGATDREGALLIEVQLHF